MIQEKTKKDIRYYHTICGGRRKNRKLSMPSLKKAIEGKISPVGKGLF